MVTKPDLNPLLTDPTSFDRAVRTRDLLASDIPEEREVGAREAQALATAFLELAFTDPVAVGNMFGTLVDIAKTARWSKPAASPLPDTVWRAALDRGGTICVRQVSGHTLVVRESGSRPGQFYAVVDGHHLSARGGPSHYGQLHEAIAAAEAAVDAAAIAKRQAEADAETLEFPAPW